MGRGEGAGVAIASAIAGARWRRTPPVGVESSEWLLERQLDPRELLRSCAVGDRTLVRDALAAWDDESSGLGFRCPEELPFYPAGLNPQLIGDSTHIHLDVVDSSTSSPVGSIGLSFSIAADQLPEMRVGMFELRFYPHGEGEPDHAQRGRSGQGFGSRALEEIFERAARLGVSRCSLHASAIGGYVWARLGFELDPRRYEGDPTHAFEDLVDRALAEDPALESSSRPRSMWELSQWGRSGSSETWAGKRALICSSWHGVRELTPARGPATGLG